MKDNCTSPPGLTAIRTGMRRPQFDALASSLFFLIDQAGYCYLAAVASSCNSAHWRQLNYFLYGPNSILLLGFSCVALLYFLFSTLLSDLTLIPSPKKREANLYLFVKTFVLTYHQSAASKLLRSNTAWLKKILFVANIKQVTEQ